MYGIPILSRSGRRGFSDTGFSSVDVSRDFLTYFVERDCVQGKLRFQKLELFCLPMTFLTHLLHGTVRTIRWFYVMAFRAADSVARKGSSPLSLASYQKSRDVLGDAGKNTLDIMSQGGITNTEEILSTLTFREH